MKQSEDRQINFDLIWNFVALGLVGVSGILFNGLIVFFYDSSVLGVINQLFALYIVFAQIGSFGIQFSAQKYIASEMGGIEDQKSHLNSALFAAVLSSTLTSLTFFAVSSFVAQILESPPLKLAISLAAIGLFFFCLNKVILGALNGLRYMRSFAGLQALRALLLVCGVLAMGLGKVNGHWLAFIFSFVETTVFAVGMILLWHFCLIDFCNTSWVRMKAHMKFGAQSMFSGILIELNTRVDILLLGFFMSDAIVGIYSFAATLAEGLSLALSVFRNNFNPILARLHAQGDYQGLRDFIKKWKLRTFLFSLVVSLCALIIYWVGGKLTGNLTLLNSFPYFAILLTGIALCSAHFPFLALLIQVGRPSLFSMTVAFGVGINIILNLILIPLYGGFGSAMATAIANILNTFLTVVIINCVCSYLRVKECSC